MVEFFIHLLVLTDVFQIEEISIYKGTWEETNYTVAAEILDDVIFTLYSVYNHFICFTFISLLHLCLNISGCLRDALQCPRGERNYQ